MTNSQTSKEFMNLPNQLTIMRIFMTAIFVSLMSFHDVVTFIFAYLVFTIASITDYYDGKIARERNIITNFGKLLDPVADKVLICSAFVMMMTLDELHVPGWAVVLIISREFLVTGARSLAATEGIIIAANKYGKLKTIFQMVYVFTFLFFVIVTWPIKTLCPQHYPIFNDVLSKSSLWCMVYVAAYTVYSGIQFTRINLDNLKLGK